MKEDSDYWKSMAIFILIWTGFFGIILPILDELFFDFAYRHFICENNLILPLDSNKEFCSK